MIKARGLSPGGFAPGGFSPCLQKWMGFSRRGGDAGFCPRLEKNYLSIDIFLLLYSLDINFSLQRKKLFYCIFVRHHQSLTLAYVQIRTYLLI